jgi:predicted homoserine dehydrogenase-like protein
VALFNDPVTSPVGPSSVEVITIAKKDLSAGETLDGIGRYTVYGVCENAEISQSENLLPLGLAEGCVLKRDIQKDEAINMDDVNIPGNRFIDKLYNEQINYFSR